MRTQWRELIPTIPTLCPETHCIYATIEGMCDDPRTNRGNSDAVCFRLSNKSVVKLLDGSSPGGDGQYKVSEAVIK